MRLAYFISEYPSRSHTFIRREIAELRGRGTDIEVFSIRRCKESELISELDRRAYEETRNLLPVKLGSLLAAHMSMLFSRPMRYSASLSLAARQRLPGIKSLVWSFFYFLEGVYLAHQLQSRDIRHLHIHFANAGAEVGKIAAYLLNISWSINLHGACDFEYPAGPLLGQKLVRTSFANCASWYGRAQALRTIPVQHWSKVFVSRCGIELGRMPDPGRIHSVPDGSPATVLSVGRLSPEKGQLGLLEAFSQARRQNPLLHLVIVGDGPERQMLEAHARASGMSGHCTFAGSVSEEQVFDYMVHADIFALASFMEGIPMVLMEAMALYLPVIAPRVAGIPELICDRHNGLLFDPGHWSQLADCIAQLSRSTDDRARLANAARRRVEEEFDIHKAVSPLFERFAELSQSRRNRSR
jgi:glycosyltransferase involved in cell wall biosynthesis